MNQIFSRIAVITLILFLCRGSALEGAIMQWQGIYAATLTPQKEDCTCDTDALYSHCQHLLNQGCDGIILFGTTGEGPLFTVDEKIRTLKALLDRGFDRQKIMVGIMFNTIEAAVMLARAAIDQGCYRHLIIPPFFYKYAEDEGIIAFYREVIHRTNDPRQRIFLYHIPQFSGIRINSHIINALIQEFPDIVVGLKESEGNLPFAKEVIDTFPGFHVFVGNELHLAEAVRYGAAGGISGMINAYPKLICSLYHFGKDPTLPDNTAHAQAIIRAVKQHPTIPALKYLLQQREGKVWATVKPPLSPLSSERATLMMNDLKNCNWQEF